MGIYYTPVNYEDKEYINWIHKIDLSDKNWVWDTHGLFLAYLHQFYWYRKPIVLEADEYWDWDNNPNEWKDVTLDAIIGFNDYIKERYPNNLISIKQNDEVVN